MRDQRRVCVLSYAPDPGGVTTYQSVQLEYLASRADVTFVDERPETTISRVSVESRARIRVLALPVWSAPRAAAAALAHSWRAQPPAVIALSNPALLVKLAAAFRRASSLEIPILQTVHSGTLTPTMRRKIGELLSSAIMRWRSADIVYVSAYTRDHWTRHYPWLVGRGRVVPNGIGMAGGQMEARALTGEPRVVFVGRLELEKGIDLFLDVAREARRRGHQWQFEIFGDGPQRSAVQQMVPQITWHGHVNDANAIFERDLLLVTSPIENAPYVVLEAKRAGVPVVAARVGGLSEMIEDGVDGVFSRSRSAHDFVDALERALSIYSALSAGCVRSQSAFDVARQLEATWKPYLT